MGKLFGTDGVRGVAGEELTADLAMSIGKAAATVLEKRHGKKPLVIVGKDTRRSSEMLELAVSAGLCECGADVIKVGVLPTPAVAYLVGYCKADAGVMISASHNSFEYNGIKIFGDKGYKLSDEEEAEIEEIILNGKNQYSVKTFENIGRYTVDENAHSEYVKHILESVKGVEAGDLNILIDCCNGSASATAGEIFKALGCKYKLINSSPDGLNINAGCGSTHIEKMCDEVVKGGYDLGIAFDGDADRLLAVDKNGEIVTGDMLIAIFADYMKSRGRLKNNTAVVTVMSNLGFMKFCEEHDINVNTTKVGDRYVLQNMLEQGHVLGGEDSGHIIFLDYMTTGDGQLSALQLIKVMCELKKPLHELKSIMKKYPQTLVNVKVTNEVRNSYMEYPEVRKVIDREIQKIGVNGRILVRASGTEPLVRVMVEAQTEEIAENTANTIADEIKKLV